jgi:hypothetical protein
MRRQYLVRRRFQGRFIVVFLGLASIAAIAAGVVTGVAVDQALASALFRAHFVEQSTGEIVLPVMLKVNGSAVAATLVCAILVAHRMFCRAMGRLDALTAHLANWASRLAGVEATDTQASAGSVPETEGWTADLERSLCAAQRGLQARYAETANEARALVSEAQRLRAELERGADRDEVRCALDATEQRLRGLDCDLARFQEGNGPRSVPAMSPLPV